MVRSCDPAALPVQAPGLDQCAAGCHGGRRGSTAGPAHPVFYFVYVAGLEVEVIPASRLSMFEALAFVHDFGIAQACLTISCVQDLVHAITLVCRRTAHATSTRMPARDPNGLRWCIGSLHFVLCPADRLTARSWLCTAGERCSSYAASRRRGAAVSGSRGRRAAELLCSTQHRGRAVGPPKEAAKAAADQGPSMSRTSVRLARPAFDIAPALELCLIQLCTHPHLLSADPA